MQFYSVPSEGATRERQIQNRVFWSISYQFEEGQRRQLCIDFAIRFKTRCALQPVNILQFRRQVAPQESLMCGGNIQKRKNSAAQLREILRILTINSLINSTRVQQHMHVTISCRYALSFVVTGRIAAKRQTPALNLLTGKKSGFSPRRGDKLHRFTSNLAGLTGMWVRLAVQNFTSIATGVWECGPENIKKIHFLIKRGVSLDRFRKFLGAFMRLTILHQVFKFGVVCFTGY